MAERQTIEMGDREMFAAMAMQALITREGGGLTWLPSRLFRAKPKFTSPRHLL